MWSQRRDAILEIPGPSHKDPAGCWLAPIQDMLRAGQTVERWRLDPVAKAAIRSAVMGVISCSN
eukprot:9315264-Pyramimonas_sp.AAC.1